MQMIQFMSSSSGSSNGIRAVAPIATQASKDIAVAAGGALQDLVAAIPSGMPAAAAGQIINTGCYDLKVVASYLTGADCDSCTVDTLTTVDVTLIVPKNSVFPLPEGLVTKVQVGTVDSTGTLVSNTTLQSVKYYGSYAPGCGGAVLVP